MGHLGKVGRPLAFEARASYLIRALWRSRFIGGSIQAGYEGDRIGELAAALEHFERGVSAISDGHDLPLWLPTPYHQKHLPGPLLGYLLVASLPRLAA